jgi:enterochelin esterase-like enzyme
MNRPVLAAVLCAIVAAASTASAQQPPTFISPEVHADGRVTFRFWAPRAHEVRVTAMENQQPVAMTKGAQGLWTATVGPLEPNIYSYAYEVDGAPTIDPRNPAVKVWLQLNSMVEVPGTPPRLHEVQDVPHGTIVLHTYRSKALNQTRQVFVYTPPGYQAGTAPLPVVYLRHGFGDDASAWTAVGRAHVIADNLIAQKRIEPMLIVMPYGHHRSPRTQPAPDREDNDAAVERDLLEDVLPLVESAYRVARDPERRAIVGLSMGGGQALKTGLRHLDTFRWVGAFSAAAPQGDPSGHFPTLKADAAAKLRLLWIGIGKDDFLLTRNEEFDAWLKEQGFPYTYTVTAGAHDWIVWRRYLAEFLPLLFTRR